MCGATRFMCTHLVVCAKCTMSCNVSLKRCMDICSVNGIGNRDLAKNVPRSLCVQEAFATPGPWTSAMTSRGMDAPPPHTSSVSHGNTTSPIVDKRVESFGELVTSLGRCRIGVHENIEVKIRKPSSEVPNCFTW